MTLKDYEKELRKLHVELVKLQQWVVHEGLRVCVVFEGRDGAGKGGTIKAITERVMGFCTEAQAQKFLKAAPMVEKAMVDDGIILIKYWLEVSPDEQTRRMEGRITDGRKLWKLSPMDIESYKRWYDYSRARDEMIAATDTEYAPWHVARSDDKKRVRLNIISHLLGQIPYKELPRKEIKLPSRQKPGDYRETDYPFKYVPEVY